MKPVTMKAVTMKAVTMKPVTILRCLLPLTLLVSAASGAAEHAAATDAGRELFMSYQCWQCHGYEGQGGAAPRLAQSAYPWEAFVRFVRYPNEMPAYTTELLSDEDLRAIYDFLQSIPAPPPVEEIPALDDL